MKHKHADVLAIAPHPDDVEMGCGGTMLKLRKIGYTTGIIDLTAGELGTRGTRKLRAKEAANAAKILGLTFRSNLDLGDGHIMNNDTSRKTVVKAIRESRPKLILTSHWFDDHPDHVQCAYLVKDAVYLAGLQNYLPEIEYHRTKGLAYFMSRGEFQPTFIVDITDEFPQKMEAIQAYTSQFHHANQVSNEPETALSHPEFLKIFETRGRFYGRITGCKYAEPFFTKYPPKIIDPVAIW